MDFENNKAQMKKGTLEFCTLLIISKGEVYASGIIEELKKNDLIVVEGTMYPLLSRMKNAGLLSYNWVESAAGPPRKYYELTPKGRETLEKFKENWTQFTNSINKLLEKHEKNS